jgi:hypothetical protein
METTNQEGKKTNGKTRQIIQPKTSDMIIKYEKYTLTPEPTAPGKFNINVERTVDQSKTGAKNKTRKVVLAYGCTLESSLRTITEDKLAQKSGETNFNGYIQEFKSELAKISNVLKT